MALLDAMENEWRSEQDRGQPSSFYSLTYSSWISYGASLVTNILQNLQVGFQLFPNQILHIPIRPLRVVANGTDRLINDRVSRRAFMSSSRSRISTSDTKTTYRVPAPLWPAACASSR